MASKASKKTIHPIDQIAADLTAWGSPTQAFRFSRGVPLLLVTSRRTGYRVWVALHIDAKQTWSRELVEQIVHTNYGAMVATSFADVKQRLRDRAFIEAEDRQRLADLLTASDAAEFDQRIIAKVLEPAN